MPDTKITALTALTAADPANDVLPIVDVSDTTMAASGTTKKISINNVLGASGTATLASATISGDLTVDTSTLKVDSANNRVGVLNAAPNDTFTIASDNYLSFQTASTGFNSGRAARIGAISAGSGNGYLVFETYQGGSGGAERYRIASDGVATWSNVGGGAGTAMTLNSTGLGVGGSPVAASKLTVVGGNILLSNAYYLSSRNAANTTSINLIGRNASDEVIIDADGYGTKIGAGSALQIVSAGNVGIGVTPSAIGSLYRSVEFARGVSLFGQTDAASMELTCNAYIDSAFSWTYKTTAQASHYRQFQGTHQWHTAPSGTAGNAITFTERLRLKETGQLRFVPLAADPSGAEAGDVYYNSTSNKLKCYNGTTWNDLF